MSRVHVGVLISGRGSNMEALIAAAKDPAYPAQIALVISNNPDAPGLEKARAAGAPTLAIDQKAFPKDREGHERAIDWALREAGVEIVALAGYMRLLSPFLVQAWAGRMINIHPSLLPDFPGAHAHRDVLAARPAKSGCTVHLVTEGMDEGPILAQAEVPLLPGDTEETLGARVLAEEHRLYAQVLAEMARKLRRSA